MEQRHLIVVDEQSQADALKRIGDSLLSDSIELICTEIDPRKYKKRLANGDVIFDREAFTDAIKSVPFINHLDVFATDYNLIENQLKGIDVVKMFNEINPYYKKRIVIYSAQIETVINDILTGKEFDQQQAILQLITQHDISYLTSAGEFENKFKHLIEKEPNITIDARLAESMMAIDSGEVSCVIPTFEQLTLGEIAKLLLSKSDKSIALRKELTDHILACITKFKSYE